MVDTKIKLTYYKRNYVKLTLFVYAKGTILRMILDS